MNLILFDGECNLCNHTVRFIIRHDKKDIFRFAALQSEVSQKLLRQFSFATTDLSTVIYIENGIYYTRSTAILRILKKMGSIWKWGYVFIVIPAPIRDYLYGIVARLRHRIFSKTKHCPVLPVKFQSRFIDRQ